MVTYLKMHGTEMHALGPKTRDVLLCGLNKADYPLEFCSFINRGKQFYEKIYKVPPNLKVLILNLGVKPQNTNNYLGKL